MSLYEQYHSDLNKNYIFDLIKKILLKDHNIIVDDDKYLDIFNANLNQIFKDNNVETLEELNKILLNYNLNFIVKNENNTNKSLEDLIKARDNDFNNDNSSNISNDTSNISNDTSNDTSNISNNTINNDNSLIGLFKKKDEIDNNDDNVNENNIIIKRKNVDEKEDVMKIFSNKRKNVFSSRYNYTVDISNIEINKLNNLSKILLPIEDNYIFSTPIILIYIKELNIEISLFCDKKIEKNKRIYGIYLPLERNRIKLNDNITKLTIDIRDISNTRYDKNDISKVNILELKNNNLIFTCSTINRTDYLVDDYIKIINNNKKNLEFLKFPLKIIKISRNKIYCKIEDNTEELYLDDVDMRLLNLNNQNIIYFN